MAVSHHYSGVRVRVVRPNLLFCIHQRYSEGVCRGEGKSRSLSRS